MRLNSIQEKRELIDLGFKSQLISIPEYGIVFQTKLRINQFRIIKN